MKRILIYLTSLIATCWSSLTAQEVKEIWIVPNDIVPFEELDIKPEYKGGQKELYNVLSNNLIYPEECLNAKIQGTVNVNFIVNSLGGIENIRVLESVHPLLDKEAIRVVRLLTEWIPAKKGDKSVSVFFNLPITFKLPNNEYPDFSKFNFFELRDILIAFLEDLYREVPNNEQNIINAEITNEYIGIKCQLHFAEVSDEFKNITEDDLLMNINEFLTNNLPYEFRKALSEHDIKLTYEYYIDSENKKYKISIENSNWIPETTYKSLH